MRRGAQVLLLVLLAGCEGGGDGGGGLEVRRGRLTPGCVSLGRSFPSGLALRATGGGRAAVALPDPPSVWALDLESEAPRILAVHELGPDSDADGRPDEAAMRAVTGLPLPPITGDLAAPADDLALVSTSGYEQVLFFDAATAAPRGVQVETPASVPADRHPLLPPPGETHLRSGVSTLACATPPDPIDSEGGAIGEHPACPGGPSYLTSYTAGKAIAAGRLFVATSNASGPSRFRPGTVLVFEWIEDEAGPRVRPDAATPMLFTRAYNPTGVTRIVTPGGRELVLVTSTGAIGAGVGAGNIRSEGAIEVIDPSVPRIAAVIPLGFAGAAFEGLAVDAAGRIGWIGSSSQRLLFAVDLRALDTPALFPGSGPPAVLDGLSVGFPDARVFTADFPLALPDRPDGPPPATCDGFTHTAVNAAADRVYATDFCDGTFSTVRMDLAAAAPVPWPRDRFQVGDQQTPFAPSTAIGLPRAPGALQVRPGRPGVDYRGPDVVLILGQPEGQLCALRVESGS